MDEVVINSRINKANNNFSTERRTNHEEDVGGISNISASVSGNPNNGHPVGGGGPGGKTTNHQGRERKDLSPSSLQMCLHYFWNVIDILGIIITLLLQGSLINYYLILFNNGNAFWYFWFLVDFLILILFMVSIAFAKKYYSKESQRTEDIFTEIQKKFRIGKGLLSFTFPDKMGKLPLMYMSWFLYALILTTKTFILFKQQIPKQMFEDKLTSGPEIVELCLAASVIVFLLWVEAHRNGDHNKSYVNELTSITVFEIFDSIFFVDLILPDDISGNGQLSSNKPNISNALETFILLLAAVNFLLPTIQLFGLSKIDFNTTNKSMQQSITGNIAESKSQYAPLLLHFLFHLLKLFLVNIPYFFIRIHLSANYGREISIFVVKNFLGIVISLRTLASQFLLWLEIRHEIRTVKRNNPAILINKPSTRSHSGGGGGSNRTVAGRGWELPGIFDYRNRKHSRDQEMSSISRNLANDDGDSFVDVNLDPK